MIGTFYKFIGKRLALDSLYQFFFGAGLAFGGYFFTCSISPWLVNLLRLPKDILLYNF
jgi:hypothetical protein